MIKILYAEDNDDNAYMLRMHFDLLGGFDFSVAENGQLAFEMASLQRPDVVLMDLDLPVIDGWEATRMLKAAEATRNIPVIALTAHAMSGSREKALASGCDEFDTKPVDFDRLMEKINLVLAKSMSSR